jgi:hypothetical protein
MFFIFQARHEGRQKKPEELKTGVNAMKPFSPTLTFQ